MNNKGASELETQETLINLAQNREAESDWKRFPHTAWHIYFRFSLQLLLFLSLCLYPLKSCEVFNSLVYRFHSAPGLPISQRRKGYSLPDMGTLKLDLPSSQLCASVEGYSNEIQTPKPLMVCCIMNKQLDQH